EMLTFLEIEYQYAYDIILKDGKRINVDFKTEKGFIEVIDDEKDISKYKELKHELSDTKIIAIGHPKYAAQLRELDDIVLYKTKNISIRRRSYRRKSIH